MYYTRVSSIWAAVVVIIATVSGLLITKSRKSLSGPIPVSHFVWRIYIPLHELETRTHLDAIAEVPERTAGDSDNPYGPFRPILQELGEFQRTPARTYGVNDNTGRGKRVDRMIAAMLNETQLNLRIAWPGDRGWIYDMNINILDERDVLGAYTEGLSMPPGFEDAVLTSIKIASGGGPRGGDLGEPTDEIINVWDLQHADQLWCIIQWISQPKQSITLGELQEMAVRMAMHEQGSGKIKSPGAIWNKRTEPVHITLVVTANGKYTSRTTLGLTKKNALEYESLDATFNFERRSD